MRIGLVALWMLLCSITSATAQVSIGIGFPGVSIGINLPVYPQLVAVPGYPVYYAPQVNSNYFFYDGMYWVYQQDNWYASSWYNGPWALVSPEAVPLFVLRVPVRYYRQPPVYFRGWRTDAPPRWGEHWGNTWEEHHSGWDRWDRRAVPAPAPLPVYQRQYSGNRYPQVEQQQALQSQNYRYQPREAVVQQHYQAQQRPGAPALAPAPQARQPAPQERAMQQQDSRGGSRAAPSQQAVTAPRLPPPQTSVPQGPQPQQGAMQRQQPSSRTQGQDRAPQGRSPMQESTAQRPPPPPQQAAVQHPAPPAKAQGQDRAPQSRAPAQQEAAAQHVPQQPQQGAMQRQQHQAPSGRGEDKGGDKGEQQGGDRNK